MAQVGELAEIAPHRLAALSDDRHRSFGAGTHLVVCCERVKLDGRARRDSSRPLGAERHVGGALYPSHIGGSIRVCRSARPPHATAKDLTRRWRQAMPGVKGSRLLF